VSNLTRDPEAEPPKAKAIREHPSTGQAVVRTTNRYLSEVANPELRQWVVEHAAPDDRELLTLKWSEIARAATAIGEALACVGEAGGDDTAF
jgi:hypothetical protein